MRETKIVLEQLEVLGKLSYRVLSLKNRLDPKIGVFLQEEDVKVLLREKTDNLTIKIKRNKNQWN